MSNPDEISDEILNETLDDASDETSDETSDDTSDETSDETSDDETAIENKQYYDQLLYKSLTKIFRELSLTNAELKEFLNTRAGDSAIKLILKREPAIQPIFETAAFAGDYPLLLCTVRGCYLDSAELLVRSGYDVNRMNFITRIPDPCFADCGYSILRLLIRITTLLDHNSYYPFSKFERLIHLIIDHTTDLQARDNIFGDTVLHFAACIGSVRLNEIFLERGIDVNIANNKGTTPLHKAVYNSKADEIIPLLMKCGADVTAKNNLGQNILHLIAEFPVEHVDIAKILIEKGASIHDRIIDNGYQPIHIAAWMGKNELVKLFLDHGADVNALSNNDESPLYCTAGFAYSQVLDTLIKRGANVNLRTIEGHTALHKACYYAKENIDILLSAGADESIRNNHGLTPFAYIQPQDRRIDRITTRHGA